MLWLRGWWCVSRAQEHGARSGIGVGAGVCLGHEAFQVVLEHLYGVAHKAGRTLGCVLRKEVDTGVVDWESGVPRSWAESGCCTTLGESHCWGGGKRKKICFSVVLGFTGGRSRWGLVWGGNMNCPHDSLCSSWYNIYSLAFIWRICGLMINLLGNMEMLWYLRKDFHF